MRPSSGSSWPETGLRVVGLTCVVGIGVSLVMFLVSLSIESQELAKWAAATLVASAVIPYVAMRCHMAATETLTERQRKEWDRVASWGLFGFVAAFVYLMRADRRLTR